MRIAILGLSLSLLSIGCAPLVEFDVDVDGEAVVQSGSALEQLLGDFPVFDSFMRFDVADTQEFRNHQTSKDHVEEARITRITLSVVEPEDATFDFLNEITFFVQSPSQPKEQVATKIIPSGARTVDLDLRDIDVSPYVRDDTFSVTTTASGRRPSRDVTVRAELTMHVKARP